jgi:copper(I)-binding protein
MKKNLATICLSLVLSTQAFAGDAGMAKVGDVMIHDGWARASIGSAPNSAAYMTLMTEGAEMDKLLGASSPAAESVELHTHLMEDGVAKMRPVEAIEVAPGAPTVLEPGGLHVMLMGLKGTLEEGDAMPITLTFEKAGEVSLDMPIRGIKGGMKHGGAQEHDG